MIPKSIKNKSKLSFRAFLFPHRFLHRFLIDFCSPLRPTGSPKSMFFRWKNKVFFKKTPFEDNIDFGFDFGANLPPCWPPKSKIFRNYGLPRGLQNLIVFGHRFFIDFGSILASNMEPSWGPRRLKIRKNGPHKSLCSPPLMILNTTLLLFV